MGTGRRRFQSALMMSIAVSTAGLLFGTGTAFAAGDIDVLAPGNQWCVSEDGEDGAGNASACVDGKGLGNGIAALTVSPDGKRVFVLGFDSFLGSSDGDSITTYDRDPLGGSLEVDPRVNACRSAYPATDCSQGGSQAALLNAPNAIAVSPDSENVYVSARRTSSVSVFDYLAFPSEDPVGAQGPLSRKVAPDGCLTDAALVGCSDVRGLANTRDVVMSPDGATVYTAGNLPNGGIAVFDRAADGVLTQKTLPSSLAGCISDTGNGGFCTDGSNLEPIALAISDDGENLYVASYATGPVPADRDTVTVFDIEPDGSLTQKAGLTGCFSETGSGGACTVAQGLQRPVDIAVTPDGMSVYVATDLPNFEAAPDVAPLVTFDRNPEDGTLTRRSCFAAEGALGCTQTAGLYRGLTVVATDDAVYYGSRGRNANQGTGEGAAPGSLVVLNRNPANGNLTQSLPSGCWANGTLPTCRNLPTIGGVFGIAVSPDGNNLYVGSNRITVFDRDNGVSPVTSIDSGPSGETTGTSATFTFSADKAVSGFECGFDFEYQPCTSPQTYENLSPGIHTFEVAASDRFNRSDLTRETRTFTVVKPPSCETDPSLCPNPPDTTVDATVTVAKVQKVKGQKIVVAVKVRAGEDLTVKATGSIKKGKRKAAFKAINQKLTAGTTTILKLRPAKAKAGRLVAAALRGNKRTVPKLLITLTDGATNRITSSPKVTIKGRSR